MTRIPETAPMPIDETVASRAQLLVIDDDVELCGLLSEFLEPEGFTVVAAHDATRGMQQALAGSFALIVLDVMLPGASGFEVLRRLRSESEVPVLMLTARGDEIDRIVGLEIGADDYLPKPFNPRELVARIHAILRRTGRSPATANTAPTGEQIAVGDVEIDIGARTVQRDGQPIELTGLEFTLLEFFLRNAGVVVSRSDLSEAVLGRELTPYDRSLDMHVSNLRKKLGHKIGNVERIRTVRGVGYLYAIARPGQQETNTGADS